MNWTRAHVLTTSPIPPPNPLQCYNPHKYWVKRCFDPLQVALQSHHGCNELIRHIFDASPDGLRRFAHPHPPSAQGNDGLGCSLTPRSRLNSLDVVHAKQMPSSRNAGMYHDLKRWHRALNPLAKKSFGSQLILGCPSSSDVAERVSLQCWRRQPALGSMRRSAQRLLLSRLVVKSVIHLVSQIVCLPIRERFAAVE